MLRWIVGTSLKFRHLVVAAAAAVMAFGFMLLPNTPVDAFPEFAPPRVEVQVPCLGLSATEVEELVTVPLEQSMAGIPGLDVMRSKSVSDLSKIELRFDQGTDLLRARQLVAERVGLVTPSLPRWAVAAVHDPAAVLDQPHHEDRVDLGHHLDHRHVDDRVLEHQGQVAPGARCREHRHLG